MSIWGNRPNNNKDEIDLTAIFYYRQRNFSIHSLYVQKRYGDRYSCETCLGFVSFGDTWVMKDCSQISKRSLLNEVKDLALLPTRSFAVLRMTSLSSDKTHTSEATYELISGGVNSNR